MTPAPMKKAGYNKADIADADIAANSPAALLPNTYMNTAVPNPFIAGYNIAIRPPTSTPRTIAETSDVNILPGQKLL